jgi:phosphatidylinositol alpha-1,6-mannosyltransferase
MKILLTLDFPPEQGGIQRYLYNMVKYCYDRSDRVLVGSSIKPDERIVGLPCTMKYYSNWFSKKNKKVSLLNLLAALLINLIKYRQNATVEAGNIYAAIPVFLISLFWPVKYNVYCYGKEIIPLVNNNWRTLLFRGILNRAENIFYITRHTASFLSLLNVDHKLRYLPPKIEKSLLNDVSDKVLHDPVHLLSVGRLQQHKGHDFLLDLMTELPANIKWQLTIAGSGPQHCLLRQKIEDYYLKDKIHVTGMIPDKLLWELYESADIFLFPSRETNNDTEGFGIVLLEAMAKGVAIVASQVGGIAEVLDNGNCGLLVPPDQKRPWIDAITKLISDQELRIKLIQSARKRVEQQYVW